MKNTVKQKEDYVYKMSNHYYKQSEATVTMFIPLKKEEEINLIEVTYYKERNTIDLNIEKAFKWSINKSELKDQLFSCHRPYRPFLPVRKSKITRNINSIIVNYLEEFKKDIDLESYQTIKNTIEKINHLL